MKFKTNLLRTAALEGVKSIRDSRKKSAEIDKLKIIERLMTKRWFRKPKTRAEAELIADKEVDATSIKYAYLYGLQEDHLQEILIMTKHTTDEYMSLSNKHFSAVKYFL